MTSFLYSFSLSAFPSEAKSCFWIFSGFTLKFGHPQNSKKPLSAASMELTLVGAYRAASCALYAMTSSRRIRTLPQALKNVYVPQIFFDCQLAALFLHQMHLVALDVLCAHDKFFHIVPLHVCFNRLDKDSPCSLAYPTAPEEKSILLNFKMLHSSMQNSR